MSLLVTDEAFEVFAQYFSGSITGKEKLLTSHNFTSSSVSQSAGRNTLLIPEGKLRFILSLQDIKHTDSIEELYRKIKKD